MFNKDFYPTPDNVIDLMGFDCQDKIVLEPSAGKGNIIEYLKRHGAKEVIACENDPELLPIVERKARIVRRDFLAVVPENISHIELIVMNPPFSSGVKHLLHAWEICPPGCEVYCLLNTESLDNVFSYERRELNAIIDNNGYRVNLGQVFTDAERRTGVEVTLVRLYKQAAASEKEFDGFFLEEEPEAVQENGIMPYNGVREVVQRYINAVKLYDEYASLGARINEVCKPFQMEMPKFNEGSSHRPTIGTRDEFKKELQRRAWKHVFSLMNVQKYVTSSVMKDINAFVEQQTKVPFTMRNIYRMLEIIVGTREETFKKSLEEVVDRLTKHTKENRFHVEGWATNSGHMLNQKFIAGNVLEKKFSGYLGKRISVYGDSIEDLMKVLCNITGYNYSLFPDLCSFCDSVKMQAGAWYRWENKNGECLFEAKGFLKGTLHLRFVDKKAWEQVNRKYAAIKGQVLPEKM